MALRPITTKFNSKPKEIKYLAKTFPEFRDQLINLAKVYFPDTYNDFNETSPGMMFIEMASAVGDVLSYYMDSQFKENLLEYAEETQNVVSIAQSLGYKPRPATPASVVAQLYQIVPALGIEDQYAPDTRFFFHLAANLQTTSDQYPGITFRTLESVNFADPINREIAVHEVDTNNNPQSYVVKKDVVMVAGNQKQYQQIIGDPEKFLKIELPDQDVLDIISVTDSSGNVWREVDFLGQDVVFEETPISRGTIATNSNAPFVSIRAKTQPRRFVTRYNDAGKLELQFGSGVSDVSDEQLQLEPRQLATSEYQQALGSTTLDPSQFLSNQAYGLAPSNTTLTILYAVGGGVETNIPSNALNKIATRQLLNSTNGFTDIEVRQFNWLADSTLSVNNDEPATGGKDRESVEEIRQNALAFFNSQNRLVTAQDYVARTYAMPARFGGIAKAFVIRDDQIGQVLSATVNDIRVSSTTVNGNGQVTPGVGVVEVGPGGQPIPRTPAVLPTTSNLTFAQNRPNVSQVNLYVLGYDKDGNITRLNTTTKNNLAVYLNQYRILTDNIRILDAFVVNIGVSYRVVAFAGFAINDVIARCSDAVANFFDIKKWSINQPIILKDLFLAIGQVEGVQTVSSVSVFNRYAWKDGLNYEEYVYDIGAAERDGIIYPSMDPCIFELRYPTVDILGSATH